MSKYEGDLTGFPKQIVKLMLKRQSEQGNPKDVSVFTKNIYANKSNNGFIWRHTPEDHIFWGKVIGNKNFKLFFDKYPKKVKDKYPKLMYVSDYPITDEDLETATIRLVLQKFNNLYFAICASSTIKDAKRHSTTNTWKYARPIEKKKEEIVELTIKDISEGKGKGIKPKNIKIKE